MKPHTFLKVFSALQFLVLATFLVSIFLILSHEELKFDPSAEGLKHALELFTFPLACIAAFLAIMTLHVAVQQLIESSLQSAAAAWETVQSTFLVYAKDQSAVPLSLFSDAPFRTPFRKVEDAEMFTVEYPVPTVTLRRLLDSTHKTQTGELSMNPTLKKELQRLKSTFDLMHDTAQKGQVVWLAHFVDLAGLVRQLRVYLAVQTKGMITWQLEHPLKEIKEYGHKRVLPLSSSNDFPGIAGQLRTELLCIANVLLFAQIAEADATIVVNMALRIGKIWANSDMRMSKVLDENSFENLWREPHLLDSAKLEI